MQFAQLAAQLPEDALIDLFMQAQAGAQAGDEAANDRMPGEFVDFVDPFDEEEEHEDDHADPEADEVEPQLERAEQEIETAEDDEDDEEDEEEIAPLPVRMLRNIVNRFWGGGVAVQEDSSDEDTEPTQHPDID